MSNSFKEGSLSVAASFGMPIFQLSQDSYEVQGTLFSRLERFGVALDQIQETGAFGGPGAWSLQLRFLDFRAQLLLKVGGYELSVVGSNLEELDELQDLLTAIESGIADTIRGVEFAKRAFRFYGHFELESGYDALLADFKFAPPDGMKALRISGVSFNVEDDSSDMIDAVVVLERSIRMPDGLYLNTGCVFEGKPHELAAAVKTFRAHVADVLASLRLQGQG